MRASAEVNGACSLGLALNQSANVQLTLVLEGKIMTQMRAMKMVDKDGMITKKDALSVFERKFDAMSGGRGRMTAKEFAEFARAIGEGNVNP